MKTFSYHFLEPKVSCGHRLYFSNVNWYTANKICEEENKGLVLPDSDIFNFKTVLELLITERRDAVFFTNHRQVFFGLLNLLNPPTLPFIMFHHFL